MPTLVRAEPDTPCQPEGAHHPHLYVCGDQEDCGCWDDLGDGRGYMPYHELSCCVCGHLWPCPVKKAHLDSRRDAHRGANGR